jgi:hypothetical protein
MSGKGSTPRPFSVPLEDFAASFEHIFGKPSKCPVCNENTPRCVCVPTDDGPGQEGAEESPASQAKMLYERRRFER